jgi:hypothetical protein
MNVQDILVKSLRAMNAEGLRLVCNGSCVCGCHVTALAHCGSILKECQSVSFEDVDMSSNLCFSCKMYNGTLNCGLCSRQRQNMLKQYAEDLLNAH